MSHSFLAKLAAAGKQSERLPQANRELLLALCNDVRSIKARRDIIREGDRPDHVHVMIEGWACRYKILPDGSRQITAFLISGDLCDIHIMLFDQMDHSIGSVSDCKVAFVPRAKMAELTGRPDLAKALWWANLVDEAMLRSWVVNVGRRDAFARLSHLLCELHARLTNVGLANGCEFELPLTQEALGDALGLTSVHVNRTLKRLREEGLIAFPGQHIVLLDVARLQKLAGFDPTYLHLSRQTVDP